MLRIEDRFFDVLSRGVGAFDKIVNLHVLGDYEVQIWASTLAHEIFESYLMIEAGSYLRVIDRSSTQAIFDRFFSLLEGDSRFADPSEYVAHSVLSQELVKDFPDFSWQLEKRMHGGMDEKPNLALRVPELFRANFSRIMLLQVSMLEQPSVRVFCAAIRNISPFQWDRLMEHRPRPETVAHAGESTEITPEGIYHGFFSLLGTISSINDALGDLSSSEESADATNLLEYARKAIDWRIDFRSHEFSRRFDLLRKNVLDDATRDLSGYSKMRLRQELEDVLDSVVGLVPA